ncbi:regulatory protein RecX [Microbulbifer bruguierae]|uniref:Regulatory protein RecX n=1 Tax=Microbulbifer bruguierae TaxID=3029061 RepID=A0ABY8NEV3_9GAMM|nr:regulatory protein RecX [Microbulbifer bruguierae]WGL16612.1 regulatory protein RecX [Microbulbifer bruguierae]
MSSSQGTSGGLSDWPSLGSLSDSPPDTLVRSRESSEAFQKLFTAALELLSRREHSCHELRQKLLPKHPDADFDGVLLRLQELNYQSDQRFAEVFCRSRVQRGQGPLRIRQELQLRGVRSVLVQTAMEQLQEDVDWYQLALEQLQRKFRQRIDPALPWATQQKERARRHRYLAYRGFFTDAIQFALAELDTAGDAAP